MAEATAQSRSELKNLQSLELSVGRQLYMQTAKNAPRLESRCVGFDSQRYIILELPAIPGIREMLFKGRRLTIRYIASGKVFGFETSIMGHIIHPVPLLFLDYPRNFESLNLRACERVDTLIKADLTIGYFHGKGMIVDLSCGGCRVIMERDPGKDYSDVQKDRKGELSFTLAGQRESVTLPFRVVKKDKEVGKFELSLKFEESQEDLLGRIEEYVDMAKQFVS